jgi:hypothetical protein
LISLSGCVKLINLKITNKEDIAIKIGYGNILIQNCELSSSKNVGLLCTQRTQISVLSSKISSSEYGVVLKENSFMYMLGCTVVNNNVDGIHSLEESTAVVCDTLVSKNGECSINFKSKGKLWLNESYISCSKVFFI